MKESEKISAPRLAIVLARCSRAVSQVAEQSVSEAGMCLTDFVALEALLHKGPLTITEIQDKVQLASGSMTAAVDRLEKKAFIRRTPALNDRRAKLVELTAKGRSTVKAVFDHHAAVLEETMKVLSNVEKSQLHRLLKKLGLFAAAIKHSH
jgi:MarR family 2-MHQ and catechol resistance regulon transcriptional repressor